MNHFVIMIKVSFKRFFTKKRLTVYSLTLIISLVAFHMGVLDYKDINRENRDFKKVESYTFNHLTSWADYSEVGTGVFFRPAPEMVFFVAPSKFVFLIARINTIAALNIQQNRKEESVASRDLAKSVRVTNAEI